MDSYQLYKSIYDRELSRRKDLDSAINLPLTIISILVAANSYIINQKNSIEWLLGMKIQNLLLILIFIGLTVTIYFLTRSYNNFFKGFAYRNLGLTTSIRKYEKLDIPDYNSKVEESKKILFEDKLIEKLISIIDNHIIFNDRRSLDIYRAKTFIIISLILTAFNFVLFTFQYIKS